MVHVKRGGSVPTEGSGSVVFLVIVILGADEVTFDVVVGRTGRSAGIKDVRKGVDLEDLRGETALRGDAHALALRLVVLVTHQHVDIVIAERVVVSEGLELVETQVVGGTLVEFAVDTDLRTVVRVVIAGGQGLSPVDGRLDGRLEEARDVEVGGESAGQVAALVVHLVVAVGTEGVTGLHETTAHAVVGGGHTVVILLVTELVGTDDRVAVRIHDADIHRIDRGDVGRVVHQVGRTPVGAHVRVGLLVGLGETDVRADSDPLLHLVVGPDAGGETLVTGVLDDTVLIEITEGGIEVTAVGTAVDGDVVVLTDGVLVSELGPVVRLQIVGLTVELVRTAEGGVRVQLAVGTDQVLAFRNREHVVTEVVHHIAVRACESVRGRGAGREEIIVQRGIVSLVELAGLGDNVVVLDAAAVHTHAHVHIDLRVAGTAALGGHEDDAGGATGAVQGGGSRILQDGDALDVTLRDVGQAGRIRSAVDDDERIGRSGQGGNTADVDATAAGTRGAGGTLHLETGHLADQGVGNIGRRALLQFIGFHHGRGAGEGLLRGRTESDDDGFVQQIGVLFHDDVDDTTSFHRNLLADEADVRDGQDGVRRSVDGVSAICTGNDAIAGTVNDHRCSFKGGSREVGHRTADGDILREGGHRREQNRSSHEKKFHFFHKLDKVS